MQNLGIVKPGTTLRLNFDTFDGGTGAPITMTGFTTADIEIYKDDGFVTQRASDNGYALLDDGIDVDGITGVHAYSVDLADNTTAGFYACGSHYAIRIGPVTVDAQTVNFWHAEFTIGQPAAMLDTTISSITDQDTFVIAVGPADDDALNGCVVVIQDVASAVQLGFAVVTDYTGSSRTVQLLAGPTYTLAATDSISFFPPVNNFWFGQVAQTGDGTNLTETGGDGAQLTAINLPNQTMDITGTLSTVTTVTNQVTADVTAISGDSVAADRLEGLMDGTLIAQVNDASALATAFAADQFTEATDDHFNGRLITFISGALTAQQTDITDYDAAGGAQGSQEFTVTALTEAPADGDFFVIH